MSTVEELLKRELGTKILRSTGKGGSGCINEGSAYETDDGIVFIKLNGKPEVQDFILNLFIKKVY